MPSGYAGKPSKFRTIRQRRRCMYTLPPRQSRSSGQRSRLLGPTSAEPCRHPVAQAMPEAFPHRLTNHKAASAVSPTALCTDAAGRSSGQFACGLGLLCTADLESHRGLRGFAALPGGTADGRCGLLCFQLHHEGTKPGLIRHPLRLGRKRPRRDQDFVTSCLRGETERANIPRGDCGLRLQAVCMRPRAALRPLRLRCLCA